MTFTEKAKTRWYAILTCTLLFTNMTGAGLDLFPDWWYRGYYFELETKRILTIAISGLLLMLYGGLNIYFWGKEHHERLSRRVRRHTRYTKETRS
jgi:hypothetical protein